MVKYEIETRTLYDAISSDGFEGCDYFNPCKTEYDKALFSFKRFLSEYGFFVKRDGLRSALIDWLQGLALNIPFCYCDIIALAEKSQNRTISDKEADKICDNYFPFMATRLVAIWRKNRVL